MLCLLGASNLTLPNSPTLQQSTSGSGSAGIILLPDRSFIACSGAELYKVRMGMGGKGKRKGKARQGKASERQMGWEEMR